MWTIAWGIVAGVGLLFVLALAVAIILGIIGAIIDSF